MISLFFAAVMWKGDILSLTPLICLLSPPMSVFICLCVQFLTSSASLSLPFSSRQKGSKGLMLIFVCAKTRMGVLCVWSRREQATSRRCPHCFLRDEGHQSLSRGCMHLAMVGTGKAQSVHYQLCVRTPPSGYSGPGVRKVT